MHNLNAWLTTESDHDKEEYETRTAELHCKIKHVYKIKQDMSHLLEEGITDVNAEKMEQEEKTVVKKEISTVRPNL